MILDSNKISRRLEKVPTEVSFEDENGNPLEDFGVLKLDYRQRVLIAELSLKWKQSVEVTLERFTTQAIKHYLKKVESERDG